MIEDKKIWLGMEQVWLSELPAMGYTHRVRFGGGRSFMEKGLEGAERRKIMQINLGYEDVVIEPLEAVVPRRPEPEDEEAHMEERRQHWADRAAIERDYIQLY